MKMKRWFPCVAWMLAVLLLVGCSGAPGKSLPAEQTVQLGDLNVTVTLPTDLGFEAQESQLNDFFGAGASGEWCIIANVDEKGEYPLEEYAHFTAQANGADDANVDANGNYYFTYINEEEGYRFYTAVREDTDHFYRIAFYCHEDLWESYEARFIQWAATIQLI